MLKPITTIHTAFCLAIFLFGLVSYFLNAKSAYFSTQLGGISPYYLLFPLIGLIAITVASSLYNKKMVTAKEEIKLTTKIEKYKEALILRCALIEGGAILNIVGFMLSSNLIFLAFAGISLLSLFSLRPNKALLIETLQINPQDIDQL